MRCTISQIYFDKELLQVLDRSTVHHQQYLNTVYTEIGICRDSYVDCLLARSGPLETLMMDCRSVQNL